MEKIKSKPGLVSFYNAQPLNVRWYFDHVPKLIELFPLDVALAYVFAQVELAHNLTLYCGVAKLHGAETTLAFRAIQVHHMTRDEFRRLFEVIYGKRIPESTAALLLVAEGVRDRVMHGKGSTDDQKRNAIAHVLQYANEMNTFVVSCRGPAPFADLRGFKGSKQSLDKNVTKWMLRGMGFNLQ